MEHYADYRDVGVGLIHQPAHLVGEVLHGAPLGYRHMAPALQRDTGEQQIAGTSSHVFVVLALGAARALPTVALWFPPRVAWRSRQSRPPASGSHRARGRGPKCPSIAATNSPPTFGMRYCCFRHGLNASFQMQAHRLVGEGLYQSQLHGLACQRVQRPVIMTPGAGLQPELSGGLHLVVHFPVLVHPVMVPPHLFQSLPRHNGGWCGTPSAPTRPRRQPPGERSTPRLSWAGCGPG